MERTIIMTKKFEEKFPELKLFTKTVNKMEHSHGSFESREGITFVFCHAIETHCLSKQRVKEAIDKELNAVNNMIEDPTTIAADEKTEAFQHGHKNALEVLLKQLEL